MISQRQIAFRQEYRSRIVGWYDGYFHIAVIYAMGAAAFYIYIKHIHNVTLLEWLAVTQARNAAATLSHALKRRRNLLALALNSP